MEDVGRAPADVSPVQTEPASISTLDGWIENLMKCKQLAENDVQRLCDKVSDRSASSCRCRALSLPRARCLGRAWRIVPPDLPSSRVTNGPPC